jgi:hypothetical protein
MATVSVLADEVADLIRHDNIDTRILDWVAMTYNDITTRCKCWLFTQTGNGSVASQGSQVISMANIGNPISVIMVDPSNSTLYFPKLIPFGELRRFSHNTATLTEGKPTHCAFGPGDRVASSSSGKSHLWIYPATDAANWVAQVIYWTDHLTDTVTGAETLGLPVHFEHVLVWGAAARAASILRPELYPIYQQEYESALANMKMIMTYKPDLVPYMRAVSGPYAQSSRMNTMPRFPSNIS